MSRSSSSGAVTFRIPKDGSQGVKKLEQLSGQLATHAKLPSGLEVSKKFVDGDQRVAVFLDALREVLAGHGVDLDEEMKATFRKSASLPLPDALGSIASSLLTGGGARLPMSPSALMDMLGHANQRLEEA